MKLEIKSVEKDYTHCNFCQRGSYKESQIVLPFKEVIEIGSDRPGGIIVAMCAQCLAELKEKTKDIILK